MKQEELMIGDWVQSKADKTPIHIDSHWEIYNAKDFEPIPISSEILIKNNFNRDRLTGILKGYIGWTSEDRRINISNQSKTKDKSWAIYVDDDNYRNVGRADIEYIHELQHALKLCKIDKEIKL